MLNIKISSICIIFCAKYSAEIIHILSDLLGFNLLVLSKPFPMGHFWRTDAPAGVGGQHKYESHVQLQYAPVNYNNIISIGQHESFLFMSSMSG